MKKIIIILIPVLFALTANAQVEVRPFVGANFSDVSQTPDNTTTQAKLGGQIGVGLIFGNKLYFSPQIAYFSRSTEFSFAGDDGNADINADQNVEGVLIPLLLGVRIIDPTDDPFFNLRVFGGPSMQFLTKKEFTNNMIDESVDWNTTQWAAQVGAGIDVSIFFVDASYEFGLTKTNEPVDGSNFDDIKNNTFYVNAGIRLTL